MDDFVEEEAAAQGAAGSLLTGDLVYFSN